MSTSIFNISSQLENTNSSYSNEEYKLSNTIFMNESKITEIKNIKTDGQNPVITGSLLLNSENNELKIGNNWSLKASTHEGQSTLAFYYNGIEALPFMAIGVNNITYEPGMNNILSSVNNITSSMKIISINGSISNGDYKMFFVLENGLVDQTSYSLVTINTEQNIVIINVMMLFLEKAYINLLQCQNN